MKINEIEFYIQLNEEVRYYLPEVHYIQLNAIKAGINKLEVSKERLQYIMNNLDAIIKDLEKNHNIDVKILQKIKVMKNCIIQYKESLGNNIYKIGPNIY